MIAIVPKTARPMRQVRPTMSPLAVADRRDAVQRALDAGAVVVAELADALDDVVEVVARHFGVAERDLVALVARLREPAEVHARFPGARHDCQVRSGRPSMMRRENREQIFEIIGHFVLVLSALRLICGGAFDGFRGRKGFIDIFQCMHLLTRWVAGGSRYGAGPCRASW